MHSLFTACNLLLGNIDFSFVLIFLFPLLIIAFTYNIISEEKESGTWKIVIIQSQSPFKFIFQLFTVRFFIVLSVLVITLLLAIIFLQIPLDIVFWMYSIVSILYILFWFSVCFWVASLHKSSNFNAVLLLTIWILLIIILPASMNNYLVNKYPTPEALETTLKQRKGYHEKWDMDKQPTVDKFFVHYPQFKKFKMPEGDFNWLWYYAMQQMGDDESAKHSKELREKLEKRNEVSANIAQFIPTLHLQIQLNEMSKSGFKNQLFFMDEMGKFHEKIRLYSYPKIFSEAPVSAENWDNIKMQISIDESSVNYPKVFLPILAFVGFFMGLGWLNFRRNL